MDFGGNLFVKQLVLNVGIAILFLIPCLQANADRLGQRKITLSVKNASLETVFKAIKKQTGYGFLLNCEWLQQEQAVTMNVKGVSLDDVLHKCFGKQKYLDYLIVNRTIVVIKKGQDSGIGKADIKGMNWVSSIHFMKAQLDLIRRNYKEVLQILTEIMVGVLGLLNILSGIVTGFRKLIGEVRNIFKE